MKNLKTTIITLLLLAATSALVAQEKYEFATIAYPWLSGRLYTSINGEEFSEVRIELPKAEYSMFNSNPLLLKVNEFQDKGWEVLTLDGVTMGMSSVYTATLRKKKQ